MQQVPCLFPQLGEPGDERPRFGLFFPAGPAAPAAPADATDRGVILCGAFGKEFEIVRTQISHFGREVAARGCAAFRFDYWGYGDSGGEFTEACVTTMAQDVDRAIDELRRRARTTRVSLLGIRFGAVIAAAVAARRDDIDSLVLWAPTLKPWDYLYDGLRQTLAMQTLIFRDIKITRDEIVANVLAGRPSLVGGYDLNCTDDGFPLGAPLVREVKALDLFELSPRITAATQLVHVCKQDEPPPKLALDFIEKLRAAGVPCRLDVVVEPTLPWMHGGIFAARAPNLFEKTFEWLERSGERGSV